MNRIAIVSAFFILSLVAPPAARAGDGEAYRKILEAKAPMVVTVKLVLRVQSSLGGGVREANRETLGVVVDPAGLVMLSSRYLGGSKSVVYGGRRIETRSEAADIKVVFGNESSEYEAVVAATDSKLGLGFVQIRNLGDRKRSALDLAGAPEPAIGQEIVCVLRFGRGFDFAPCFGSGRICGEVKTPRRMWAVTGASIRTGLPVFDLEGRTVGVVARQAGSGDGARKAGVFVLPAANVAATVERARKKAADVLRTGMAAKPGDDGAGGAGWGGEEDDDGAGGWEEEAPGKARRGEKQEEK